MSQVTGDSHARGNVQYVSAGWAWLRHRRELLAVCCCCAAGVSECKCECPELDIVVSRRNHDHYRGRERVGLKAQGRARVGPAHWLRRDHVSIPFPPQVALSCPVQAVLQKSSTKSLTWLLPFPTSQLTCYPCISFTPATMTSP